MACWASVAVGSRGKGVSVKASAPVVGWIGEGPLSQKGLAGAALRQAQGRLQPRALAPSHAKAGGEEGRLRAIGLRPDERHRAVLDGRTGWGGVSSRSARTVGTPSQDRKSTRLNSSH